MKFWNHIEIYQFWRLHDFSVSCVFTVLHLAESVGIVNTCLIDAVFVCFYLLPTRGLGEEINVSVLNDGMPSILLFLVIIQNDIVINMVHQ